MNPELKNTLKQKSKEMYRCLTMLDAALLMNSIEKAEEQLTKLNVLIASTMEAIKSNPNAIDILTEREKRPQA
jgi:hypothetical protein